MIFDFFDFIFGIAELIDDIRFIMRIISKGASFVFGWNRKDTPISKRPVILSGGEG
jgi:hypothetical protein